MEWSAEMASHEMWSGLDTTKTNGEVRAYFKQCLQAAFDAGVKAADDADARTLNAFMQPVS